MRIIAIACIAAGLTQQSFAQEPPRYVKTLRIQQPAPDATALYNVGDDGIVKIDWDAVETLAASKSDRTLLPMAQVMLAIRDGSWKSMR